MNPNSALTPRWTRLRRHEVQRALWLSQARFRTVPAGRRSGKTELGKRKVVHCAMLGDTWHGEAPRYFCGAPTRDQAKRIYWSDLKALTPKWLLRGSPSETELVLRYKNGAEIHVGGLDKPERVEGSPWDGMQLTEFANMKAHAWGAHLRPALADRRGWATLEGVPEGRNFYYDMDLKAQADETGEWASYTWKSSDILPAAEIEAARRDLDPLTFAQEYEASFVNFQGRCYYVFDSRVHCAPLPYNPKAPLIFTFDFNIAPGTAAVMQEMTLPGQYERDDSGLILLDRPITGTGIIGEVWIPQNSNTPAVCARLLKDWGKHQGKVLCYGDATGGAGGSAQVAGSDWDLIESAMTKQFGARAYMMNQPSNPRERARINAVNTRLLNGAGEIHMMVDPKGAPHVVKDFDGVTLLEGGSGEIDKKKTPMLTHLSDGIGYYVEEEFPIDGDSIRTMEVEEFSHATE